MRIIFGIILITITVTCSKPNEYSAGVNSSQNSTYDTLYINGIVWTGTENGLDAQNFAVTDGRISAVGLSEPYSAAPNQIVDLEGRFVMPGFIDNHVHLFDGGMGLASVDLRDAATPEEFSRRIINHAASLPKGRWVLIGNWDHELWGGELPNKEWIDEGTKDTPVFVIRLDGHMALANSNALTLAGINSDTIAPEGGEIIRNSDGTPTGILKDNAMNAVFDIIPEPTPAQLLQTYSLAQSHALSFGITQISALIGYPHETSLVEILRDIESKGAMKMRIRAFTPIENWKKSKSLLQSEGASAGLLQWGGQKGFIDGSLGSTTAWFYKPYNDQPDTNGFPLHNEDKIKKLMENADAAGLQLAIHAIGDQAIDTVLKNMSEIAGDTITDHRFRIEHFQHPSKQAIAELARTGIIASMQPYHAIDDGRWAEERIGADRIKMTYAFRSILDAGGILTFGSDWPVAPLSPLEGIYAAVTRKTTDDMHPDGWQPQEKITVDEALHAYTSANAYANFEENTAGKIEVGKRADFIILSTDPRKVEPEDIRAINVLKTIVDGKVVYEHQ